MQWLSPSDFTSQQHDIVSRKEEGTGQWFLDSAKFKEWQHGSAKTLLCPGIPGAGKTMIAAITIDHLCKKSRNEDIGVAYLFCNYKAQIEQTPTALLAAVLKQLAQSRPSTATPVFQMYEHHQKQRSRPSLDEILGALQPVCLAYPTTYIVIDALDECTNRDGARTRLIDKLRELQAITNTRLMFTSRFIPEITDEFQSELMLEVRASDKDVRRYVLGQSLRLPRCIQRSSELRQDVQDKIAEAVDGMYVHLAGPEQNIR
jgi:Cdc6-like AAA superfamily ATPase